MRPRRTLVLFDVDGTLLITGGASSRCIRKAAKAVLGERFQWGEISPGLLDPELVQDLARRCGIEMSTAKLDAYRTRYVIELGEELDRCRDDIRVLPGVRELLGRLSGRNDTTVGLLTGNYREATRLKLSAAGLAASLFPIIACAEDGEHRCDLVPAAVRQFNAFMGGEDGPSQIILVGDTPRDIECARQAGCRVLSVATGRYSLEQLRALAPDRFAADLTDPTPLEEMIYSAGS